MIFKQMEIPEVILIKPNIHSDDRGYFYESYNRKEFHTHGIREEFVQDNQSMSSTQYALRGLHFQLDPKAQGKLVRVVKGGVFDVAVDIRKGSPTFGKYVSVELTSHNRHMLYIPPGFAHGFQTLNKNTVFCYKCTEFYNKECECSIVFDDPDIDIKWLYNLRKCRYPSYRISEKDLNAPTLKDVLNEINFKYNKKD